MRILFLNVYMLIWCFPAYLIYKNIHSNIGENTCLSVQVGQVYGMDLKCESTGRAFITFTGSKGAVRVLCKQTLLLGYPAISFP